MLKKLFQSNKNKFILALVILILLLLILTLTKKSSPQKTTPLTPTPAPGTGLGNPNFQQEIGKETQSSYPLMSSLPYETNQLKIYYLAPLKLKIIIKQGTQTQAQSLVNQWIQSQEVDPNTHQFVFLEQ